jgi:hypothetical protein
MFDTVISEALRNGFSQPRGWQEYLASLAIKTTRKAPEFLAADDFAKLHATLRQAQCMVFRLGTKGSGRTNFSVVKCGSLSEQFIDNALVTRDVVDEIFFPTVPARELFSFGLIPNATENGLVSLALGARVLDHALGISDRATMPARGNGLYSFDVRPTKSQPDLKLEHRDGQVEIDSVFLGKVHGVDTIFVVEAKQANGRKGIAKAKLAYSALAVRSVLKFQLKIQLVYLLFDRPSADAIRFVVCPCSWTTEYVSDIEPDIANTKSYLLPANFGF